MSTACVIVGLEEAWHDPFAGSINYPVRSDTGCAYGYDSSVADRQIAIDPNATIDIENLSSTHDDIWLPLSESDVYESGYILAGEPNDQSFLEDSEVVGSLTMIEPLRVCPGIPPRSRSDRSLPTGRTWAHSSDSSRC